MTENNLPKKALLIVDNASCHVLPRNYEDNDFRVLFMPPNATSLIQPLDQNVLRSTKLRYRHRLMNELLACSDDITTSIKNINLKHAIIFLSEAWDSISPELIQNAWKQ